MKQNGLAVRDLSAWGERPVGRSRLLDLLLRAGAEALADHDILEMILSTAAPAGDSLMTAQKLLTRFGSFSQIIAAPFAELIAIEGVGEAGAAALKLVQAAAGRLVRARRPRQEAPLYRPVLHNWDRLIEYLTAVLARERFEQLRILHLDHRNRLIDDDIKRHGVIDHCTIDPRLLIKCAHDKRASAIILVHYHPHDAPTPSTATIALTHALKQAATSLAIVLHDHVIIGGGSWVSLKRLGLL